MGGKFNIAPLAHAFIGVGFFFIYIYHVRTVFEVRTNFSRLSRLGREALLRNEEAIYYSFYKTIVEETTFESGYEKLLNLTDVEYPDSVNAVKKFHIWPEIFIGFLYHCMRDWSKRLHLPSIGCWSIEPAGNDPIFTCDGVGDPFQFYIEFVWFLGGFTVITIYMYSSFLCETSFGGVHAVVLYIIFHKYASKIYDNPVARENFAFPFIMWQMFYITLNMYKASRSSTTYYLPLFRVFIILKLTFITTVSLLCWQFSSVIYATQILILLIPQNMPFSGSLFCIDLVISQLASNFVAFFLSYGSKNFFLSWQSGPTLALLCFSTANIYRILKRPDLPPPKSLKASSIGIIFAISLQASITDILEKSGYSNPDENSFSIYKDLVLHWTLQRRTNFTTKLLACRADFVGIKLMDCWELIKTLVVKPVCLYCVVVLAQFLRKLRRKIDIDSRKDKIERAKNYVLEDFLEENHISMKEISKQETQRELSRLLAILEDCEYDYESYKLKKANLDPETDIDYDIFINHVKQLKTEINKNSEKQKAKAECQSIPATTETETSKEKIENESILNTDKKYTINGSKSTTTKDNILAKLHYHYLYSILQFAVFAWIGVLVKKLFYCCYVLGCILAPTICSKFWFRKHPNIFWTVSIIVFLSSIFDPGIHNVENEYLPLAANDDLELMLEWINLNTEKDAVFGGPVEVIGTVHLSTRRPIINHPILEAKDMSDRTETVYSIFSRQPSSDIYSQCSRYKIQYLIVSMSKCSNSSEEECDILSIWDDLQPSYRKHSQFCTELINKSIPSFLKVFANSHYGIIKMFSQSVQVNLRYNQLPEKEI